MPLASTQREGGRTAVPRQPGQGRWAWPRTVSALPLFLGPSTCVTEPTLATLCEADPTPLHTRAVGGGSAEWPREDPGAQCTPAFASKAEAGVRPAGRGVSAHPAASLWCSGRLFCTPGEPGGDPKGDLGARIRGEAVTRGLSESWER